MLNQRLAAAKQVAAELIPAETDLDNAILHASRLAIAVIEGRRSAKLPISTGQAGLVHITRATVKLAEARFEIGAAHIALRETQDEVGLRSVAFGDLWECPDKKAELAPLAANAA